MAIFWFGYLSETSNYADVRVGYNQSGLTVYVAVFDRHLWYDESPAPETLTDWDAVTLLLDTNPNVANLSTSAYRFVAQLSGGPSPDHRSSYRGGGGWQGASLDFETLPGWRGESLNNNSGTDRGWVMTFTIPFSTLSLSAAPTIGSEWKLALQLHDRDGRTDAPQPVQVWPPSMLRNEPATWGRLRFGPPTYSPPAVAPAGETIVRRPTQNHPSVPDADVGSAITNQCPGDDSHIWNEWANRNYGSAPDFNIQNQSDIADWPCFAKYYVTFPLDGVPADKVILSATLTLHQFGNAGDANQAQPSWIQVLTAGEDWQENTITWNNAPLAWENITGRWVEPVRAPLNWPGAPWTWDVTYAVANAYVSNQPARLILYAADSAYHSGKYFVSSDTGDWNIAGRPTLRIVWGDAPINAPTNTPLPPTTPPPTDTPQLTATETPSIPATDIPTATVTASPTASMTPTSGATATATATATASASATATPTTPTATSSPVATPSPSTPIPTSPSEWTQHAHDAQRTSYTAISVPTPWRWKWAWNGPNATGGISAGKSGLPRNSQPVTGGGRVYVAAGARGVFALDNANGAVVWNRSPGGAINSTPAYDGDTGALFVVSTNGTLYKLDAATGATLDSFAGNGSSTLPLPPAIAGERVFFSMGNNVYAIDKRTMQQAWRYDAGSPADTPPAYSAVRDLVVVASRDLYVHAIRNSDGGRIWRSKTTVRNAGDPGGDRNNAEVSSGWPVIAEQNGLVLIKLRLDWQTLWRWNPWPSTNAAMRSNLVGEPAQQALLALNLDDGATAFVANVGHGGFGDGDYMPMGPQPVVKRFADGSEVAYVVMRGSPCQVNPCDGRWDSHLGEMMLNSSTVAGFEAGYVRFIDNTFFPTDEQANLSMAGDDLLGGHWMFGLAHRILDRSANRGASANNPITTANLPHIITSASNCGFSTSHYCADGLTQDGDPRTIPGGFYIYYNQGQVYDRYWSEYASWVVSNDTIYYVSTDGAVVALENGQPSGVALRPPPEQAFTTSLAFVHEGVIDYTVARSFAGRTVTVEGTLHDVFNNGKAVYLTFQTPHQGAFLVKIRKADWRAFAQPPERIYAASQRVRVTGLIEWYQGDPVIYVAQPGQIDLVGWMRQ
jgi:outer membrane protein assembly factor BamB